MTRLPRLKGKEIVRVLKSRSDSWQSCLLEASRRKSHSVPVHSGETIGPGLLRAILRDVEMSSTDFLKQL